MSRMARRSAETKALIALFQLLFAAVAFALLVLTLPFKLIGYIGARRERRLAAAEFKALSERKRDELMRRYGDASLVNSLMAGDIWHDMTREQLVQSWGEPTEIEEKALKTKIRHIYKYDQIGVNRFARRVTLDNDRVTGWEK